MIMTISKLVVCPAPVRGTELQYPITRTATRKRARVRLIPFISPSHSAVSSQVFAFLRKASCESFFLPPVELGGISSPEGTDQTHPPSQTAERSSVQGGRDANLLIKIQRGKAL